MIALKAFHTQNIKFRVAIQHLLQVANPTIRFALPFKGISVLLCVSILSVTSIAERKL